MAHPDHKGESTQGKVEAIHICTLFMHFMLIMVLVTSGQVLKLHLASSHYELPDHTKVRVEVGPGTNLDALIRDMSDKGLLTESTSGKLLPVCMKRDGCKTR